MWTPKRILLLAGGFVMFTLVYIVYSVTSLGRINTLPPLPDQYRPFTGGAIANADRSSHSVQPTPLERKLQQAFSRDCDELTWPVLLEMNSKSMVMAARDFRIAEDGRIRLEPMSLALFGKKKNDGRDVEINTLRCKAAYIRFDRPVSSFNPSELSGRKVVEAELWGDSSRAIVITNNRRTAQTQDDLRVTITSGPLHYLELQRLVKTSDHVHLEDGEKTYRDGRLIPPKAVIDAKGMEMELTASTTPSKPGVFAASKTKNESISGVKRIVLKENVVMHLCVVGGAPFPSNDKSASGGRPPPVEGKQGADAPRSPPPAHIYIATPGRFQYELFKDHDQARFDVPGDADQATSPQDVTVERINDNKGSVQSDQLVRKHLDLRIKRRDNDTTAAAAPTAPRTEEQGLEIETVHATGPDVTLTSDAEKLDAHGNDFFHDASKKLTILKGVPYMEANKDDSLIQAPELRIQDIVVPAVPASEKTGKAEAGSPKTYQQIQANGRGCIHMTNKTSGKPTVHAYWNKQLLSTRDGPLDLLILTGSASFVDDEHEQALKAETLKVWLLAEEAKPPAATRTPKLAPAAKASSSPSQSRRPHHVEALVNVLSHSREMNIHDAARLLVRFRDVPLALMPPPTSGDKLGARPAETKTAAAAPSSSPTAPATDKRGPTAAALSATPANKSTAAMPSATTGASPSAAVQQQPAPPRPIDLSARSIEADVLRCEERVVLDHLWAAGGTLDNQDKRSGVVVRQEPGKPGEDGIDIRGYTLDMKCTANGNILVVSGDLAQLKMDKIFILGPDIYIDQVQNKAWVEGEGAMQMQSNTTLEGKPLARPVPLDVHWSRSMLFRGSFAEFDGSIQARQENARLACQHLQVIFDRPISLKEGMRGDQPAKVSKLVGDKGLDDPPVRVEDQTFVRDALQKYQLLMGTAIAMSTVPRDEEPNQSKKGNDANEVTLSGPGSVRILQRGGTELVPTPGKVTPNPAALAQPAAQDQEMKLTYIRFEKLMKASTRTNVATFWEAVRVLNLPCDDPHREIDLDTIIQDLPAGAMYLRCNQLRVRTYQKQGRTYQEMEARGQIVVMGQEYTAQCDHMKFDEAKDQVIFVGEGDNQAVMSKVVLKGQPPKILRAKTIIYIRSTGEIKFSSIDSIDG